MRADSGPCEFAIKGGVLMNRVAGCHSSGPHSMGRFFKFALVVIVVLYASFLGRHGVLQQTEARYAEVAREMKVSCDFLMPTLNGVPHVQKPPVTYWLAAGSMMLFGENEIGARLPPLLAGFGVLILTAWIGTIWFNRRVGLMALFFLAGSVEFYALSRTLCADMIMTFWSTAAIAAFAYVTCRIKRPTTFHFLPFFALMGIAFATKGPMGIVVPICMAIGWQWHTRRHADGLNIPWLIGMLLTFAIASAWFLVVALRYPELWSYFLKHELIDRFFSDIHGRSKPFWFFLPVLVSAWMPWSPLAIPLVFKKFGATWHSPARWALFGWIIVPFIVLSLSGSKLATYILPLLPGMAIWFAARLSVTPRPTRALTVAIVTQMVVFVLLGVAVVGVLTLFRPVTVGVWFLPIWVVAIGMVVLTSWSMRKGITLSRVAAMSCATLLAMAALSYQIPALSPILGSGVSLRRLAERIKQEPEWEQAEIIVADARGHGVEFYLHRLVEGTCNEADVVLPLTPELAARIHPNGSKIRFATNSAPCFVVTKGDPLRCGQFPAPEWTVLQREGSFVLLYRQPQLSTLP